MITTQNIRVCFQTFLKKTFFIRVPPLDKENLNEFKGGTLMKKGPETHPDILNGCHRNPYQLENTIKSGGTLGLNSLPGSCALKTSISYL